MSGHSLFTLEQQLQRAVDDYLTAASELPSEESTASDTQRIQLLHQLRGCLPDLTATMAPPEAVQKRDTVKRRGDSTAAAKAGDAESSDTLPAGRLDWRLDHDGDALAGKRFGEYELVREIARGGMGVVYEAVQTKLARRVALKMVRSSRLATDEEIQRFHSEAEAAANLDHPHIVPIHEVGVFQGQHFFTMKLIDGGTLSTHRDRFTADLRRAAELMVQVARAVHAAHRRGILHRDLKPSNVLLSPEGVPFVADFGLAKAMDVDSGLTHSGSVLGTPSYMSPEQAAGRHRSITTASDVYSLGAILYELICGQPPFRAATAVETLRQVLDSEPLSPNQLRDRVDRDLETICLKCLRKDSQARYGSAEALADDLQRWLAGEPIAARPVSTRERIVKWAWRRPAVASLGLALLTLALVGLVLVLVLWRTASQNAVIAAEQKELAEQQTQQARANFELARVAVEQMLTQVAQQRLRFVPQMETVRRELLEEAVRFHEAFLHQNRQDPALQLDAAKAYDALAHLYLHLGEARQAEESSAKSVELARTLLAGQPSDAVRQHLLANALHSAAAVAERGGRFEDAERLSSASVEMLEKLVAQFPDDLTLLAHLANATNGLGSVMQVTQRNQEALESYGRTEALRRELARRAPTAENRAALARTFNNYGNLYADLRQHEKAEGYFRLAEPITRELVREDPNNHEWLGDLAGILVGIGNELQYREKLDESDQYFQEAIDYLQPLNASFSGYLQYRQLLANCFYNLGNHRYVEKQFAAAEQYYAASEDLHRKLVEDFPQQTRFAELLRSIRMGRANVAQYSDRVDQAEQSFLQLRSELEPIVAGQPSDEERRSYGIVHVNLGNLYSQTRDLEQAELEYRKGIKILQPLAAEHQDIRGYIEELNGARIGLGNLCQDQGRFEEAAAEFKQCRKDLQAHVQRFPDSLQIKRDLGVVSYNLGNLNWIRANLPQAETDYRTALEPLESVWQAKRPDPVAASELASVHLSLGNICQYTDRLDEADEHFSRCLELQRIVAKFMPDEPMQQRSLGILYFNRGNLLSLMKRFPEAKASLLKSVEILEKLFATAANHPRYTEFGRDLAGAYNNLAMFYCECEDTAVHDRPQALTLAQRATELAPEAGHIWNTLGICQFRLQMWGEARDSLERSISLRNGGDSYDWFFLAMIDWQQDDHQSARMWFQKAVAWREQHDPDADDLMAYQREAAQMLGPVDE